MACDTVAPVVGMVATSEVTPTWLPEVNASVTTPCRSLTALVLSRVIPSAGAWRVKFTVMPEAGTPRLSVTRYAIEPFSWMPDPLSPSTNGFAAVTEMFVAGPGGVPGGGGGGPPGGVPPPPGGVPPPGATLLTVSCTVLPAEVQLPETKTEPVTHCESTAMLQA